MSGEGVFPFDAISPKDRYKMLCAAVMPRPIAWITTRDADGVINAAPFSFFNVFAEDPALVIIGINRKPDDTRKDTVNNVEASGAFTVNLADTRLAETMVATAASFPAEVSEVAALGLKTLPPVAGGVERLAAAPIALECRLFELREFGPLRHLVMGEVLALCAHEGVFDPETHRLDPARYDPVARLYGTQYAKLGERYDLPVPNWQDVAASPPDIAPPDVSPPEMEKA